MSEFTNTVSTQLASFFIGVSDTPKYDIILTENGNVIDSFILEIFTFKSCSKRVQLVLNTCWARFELCK